MFISLLYEFMLWLLAVLALPKLAYAWIFQKKYRSSLVKRLGWQFPVIAKGDRAVIWIHAVSVGEVRAVAMLAKRLKKEFSDPILLISSITETGHAEAKRSIPEAEYHLFLPFDFNFIIAPLVKKVQPDYVLICETDFWYNFLRASKTAGAHISLVNGKISQTSAKRFQSFSFFTKPLFALFDTFALQSSHYAARFEMLGVSKKDIVITGNLKFDSKPAFLSDEEKLALRSKLGIDAHDKVVVIGSTHDTEELMLLDAIKELWTVEPNLKLIIVPRHPERFDAVAHLIKAAYGSCFRYSALHGTKSSIILLDAMGLLEKCYQIATIAIVAGSYKNSVGGHNILEPLWFGVPMIFGPHMFGQPDLVEAVAFYQAGLQVPIESLGPKLMSLLQNEQERELLRDASQQLVRAMQGSTDRTLNAIL